MQVCVTSFVCSINIWTPEGEFLLLQKTPVTEKGAPLLWSSDIVSPDSEYSLSKVSGLHLQIQLLSAVMSYFPQSAPSSFTIHLYFVMIRL